MNNRDIYLTTRKVVKKVTDKGSYNIKTEVVEQTAESTTANTASDVTTPSTNTDALWKGKQVVDQDEDNKYKKGNQLSATQLQNAGRKGSRKGITINDYEEGFEHVGSNGLTHVKRQKKEDSKND